MPDTTENAGNTAAEKKRIKDERKKLKAEQKQQKKEAKKRAKELASQEADIEDEEEGNGVPVVLITFFIVLIWVAILCVLIKLDVGGFGSSVLRPLLQDVPVVNKVLPGSAMVGENATADGTEEEDYGGYKNLREAVDQIKVLELALEKEQNDKQGAQEELDSLKAEVERLQSFEKQQVEFERIKNEFYNEVVYAEKGPGAEAYQKYYEAIDPAAAEELYKQVVQQVEQSKEVTDYAAAYSAMKPAQAAKIFEAMEDNLDLAARILQAMSTEDRGKVLGAMDAEVAARLTKLMDPEY